MNKINRMKKRPKTRYPHAMINLDVINCKFPAIGREMGPNVRSGNAQRIKSFIKTNTK